MKHVEIDNNECNKLVQVYGDFKKSRKNTTI